MRNMFVLTILALAAVCAAAQDPRQIQWFGSFEEALAEAQKKNAPIFIAINNDYPANEREKIEANRQMALVCYRDLEVVKASRRFVCVVAGHHARPLDVLDDNQECRRFGKITYAELAAVTAAVRTRFFPGETEIVAPQHLIVDPTGKLIDRSLLGRTPKEMVTLLDTAFARFRGEAPPRDVRADAASVVAALKGKEREERMAGFRQAIALLTADKTNEAVATAAAGYLRNLKDYMEIREAVELIAASDAEGPLALLLPHLRHRNARVRRAVIEVYGRGKPYEAFVDPLGKVARSESVEGPLQAMVTTLGKYADVFKEALSHLNQMVSHKQASVRVLATFAAARPDNKPVYPILLARARREANVQVRCAAILGLAQMKAKEALPTLEAARKQERKNPSLIRALDSAIVALGGTPGEPAEGAVEDEIERVKREATSAGGEDGGRGDRGDRGGPGGGRGGGRGGGGGR
ncbi:MAG: hypothetical protein JXQ29_03360 [Planctomycetes bacterium]|nr:hypothetical protein [Planctomycetota bacterium]